VGKPPPDAPTALIDSHDIGMSAMPIDLNPLRKALGCLAEALMLWHAQPEQSVLKPHLRSAVIQAFEFSYELSLRNLRRVLVERAGSADRVTDLAFNDLLRAAADAGLLTDPLAWRAWRELRNATGHADDEAKAEAVARDAQNFCADAQALLAALERAL
jgi:nucleotidyltransferase substrate binding protein (TIGR01987 family)